MNNPTPAIDDLSPRLHNKRIMIVEDEYYVAEGMARDFRRFGAEVIGPMPTLESAFFVLERNLIIDGAVLDINLNGDQVFPLAAALRERNVPFVFSTGYVSMIIPQAYRDVPMCKKPLDTTTIAQTLFPSA